MELKFKVQTKIQRPVAEVFEAVQNPTELTKYFATDSASGPLVEGATVTWRFADFPQEGDDGNIEVRVTRVVPMQLIAFEWEAAERGYQTRVEMRFEPLDEGATLVTILEEGWRATEAGLKSSYDNCHGWTQMACCLKAYLEYEINLRKGFY